MARIHRLLALLACAFGSSPAQTAPRLAIPKPASPVAITHVSIIDIETGAVRPNETVVIRGNRIAAIGPSASTAAPRGARVLEGRGKFLIPGLWDSHAHSLWPSGSDTMPYRRLMLALGITATREMASRVPLADIHAIRRRIAAGQLLAPRIAAAAGPSLDGPASQRSFVQVRWVTSADRARHLVDSLRAEGADFIKVHNGFTLESFRWVADAVRASGLPMVGHTMPGGPAQIALGMRAIEHAFPGGWCASDSLAAERSRRGAPDTSISLIIRNLRNSEEAAAHEDAAKCAAVRKLLADSGVAITSTSVQALTYRALFTHGAGLADRMRYALPGDRWRWENDNVFGTVTQAMVDLAERNLETRLRHIVAAHRAGVRILSGTDAIPFAYTIQGFSLHDELGLLVRGGLTPLEALQTATINPAAFLHMQDSLGLIAVGKVADLVVLDDNPLLDIRNASHVHAVVANGRVIDPRQRKRLLALQRQLAAGPPRKPIDDAILFKGRTPAVPRRR